MRERTTWNRDSIKSAAVDKTADPYTMNQDHSQPPADKYLTGDPSSFAEDIHPNNWDVEYGADGQTKRDEIGMPEKRPETYTHPEKTAASEEFLLKKADLCVKVSRMMLAGQKFASAEASEKTAEDQAVALMALSDSDLIETHNRLAQQQGDQESDDDDDEGQQKQAQGQQQQSDDDDDDDEGQQKQAQGQQQQSDDDDDDDEGQQKQAQGQQQKQDDDEGDDQQKQASELAGFARKAAEAIKSGDKKAAQKAITALVGKVGNWSDAPPPVAAQSDVQAQVQDMIQQAMGTYAQGQQPQQMQQPAAQQQQAPQMQDEQAMLDQMLAPDEAMLPMQEGDIEMGMSEMDTGEVVLSSDDDVLRTLFAEQQDEDDEQGGQQQQKQAGVRTASTQTVGTKPKGGVSRIGGNGTPGSTEPKLDNLWASAPDVREAFGLPKN